MMSDHCHLSHHLLRSDIAFEILLRLCAKSLGKCRCVCKSWNALISSADFHQCFRDRLKRNFLLLRTRWNFNTLDRLSLHIVSVDKEKNIISEFVKTMPEGCYNVNTVVTCLGLICMYDKENTYLCNPMTQELITLPKNSTLGTDVPFNQIDVGFGYVPASNDYKVFRIIDDMDSGEFWWRYEVFSLSSGHWREVTKSPFTVGGRYVTFADGAFYLMLDFDENSYDVHIARFNLEEEDWDVIPPPQLVDGEVDARPLVLRQVGGRLCLANYCCNWKQVNLWFLEDYNKGVWVKHNIDISFWSFEMTRYSDLPLAPLAVMDDGRILMEGFRGKSSVVQFYDPKARSFEVFNSGNMRWEGNTSFYMESFTSFSSLAKRI